MTSLYIAAAALVLLIAMAVSVLIYLVAVAMQLAAADGYQDEAGFHAGPEPVGDRRGGSAFHNVGNRP